MWKTGTVIDGLNALNFTFSLDSLDRTSSLLQMGSTSTEAADMQSDKPTVPNGPMDNPEQYKPGLIQAPQGDFMRPATRTRGSSSAKTNGVGVQVEDTRICVVMVGLPARGKSLIAQKGMSR